MVSHYLRYFFVQATFLDRSLETTYRPLLSNQVLSDRESTLKRKYTLWVFNYAVGIGVKSLMGKSGFYLITDFHPVSFFDSLLYASDNLDSFCSNPSFGQSASEACKNLENMANQASIHEMGISILSGIGFTPWGESKKSGYEIEAFVYLSKFQNWDIFYGIRIGVRFF